MVPGTSSAQTKTINLCPIQRQFKKGLRILGLIQIANDKSITLPEPLTAETILEACITKYKEKVNACHRDSAEKRQELLLSRENIAEDADDKKLASVIKQIRKRERRNKAYKKIKFSRTASTLLPKPSKDLKSHMIGQAQKKIMTQIYHSKIPRKHHRSMDGELSTAQQRLPF